MIRRLRLERALVRLLARNPVVALLGPRQCGKTTLARSVARGRRCEYFDLEDPDDFALLENPKQALGGLWGWVILDEIQRRPELFEVLRVLADRRPIRARFLLLGSASFQLVRGISESLAGRVGFLDMGGFDLAEAGSRRLQDLWVRGGFPRSLLARTDAESFDWRRGFIRTLIERDVPQLGISIPAAALRRFWAMVAHFHGQVWNAAEFARSLGSSEPTARRYLDVLSGAFVVRQIQPWFENIGKRQVKSPKIYVRDSGILHALLDLRAIRQVRRHPKLGASWEGFAIEQILSLTGTSEAYFWATHNGAELDLLLLRDGKRTGFEVKYADAPRVTRSMRIALADLRLHRLIVVHPGTRSFPLDRRIEAAAIGDLAGMLP
jgi:predicted AAA+ superfamily ATPase